MNLSLSSSGLNQADDGPSTPSSSMADPNSSGTVDLNETEVEKRHFLVGKCNSICKWILKQKTTKGSEVIRPEATNFL